MNSEQNEIDGMKKGADSDTANLLMIRISKTLHIFAYCQQN